MREMLQDTMNPPQAEQDTADGVEEAPWCQSHWADLVCPSRPDATSAQELLPFVVPAGKDEDASAAAPAAGPREVAA